MTKTKNEKLLGTIPDSYLSLYALWSKAPMKETGTMTEAARKDTKKQATRFTSKVTPYRDLSWYIKWVGTFFILAAISVRASMWSSELDFVFSLVGTVLWLIVGLMWHDRAIIVINAAAAVLLSIGLINTLTEMAGM